MKTKNQLPTEEFIDREENRRLKSMHKALMDNNSCGIIITDLEGIVVEMNQTAENILGQKVHHALGNIVQNIAAIGEYIIEVLQDEKTFEKIQVLMGSKLKQTCLLDAFPMYDENDKLVGAFAQLHDITEAYRVNEQFNYLSNHDEHTGLPNRKFLATKLGHIIEGNKSNQGGLAVIHLGLDRFKLVNDTLGYANSDHVLKDIVQRLEGSLASTEFMARVGGDEFVVIAPYENNEEIFK